jgi:PAS domain S-box-containing protein
MQQANARSATSKAHSRTSWIVLALTLGATLALWWNAERDAHLRSTDRLGFLADREISRLHGRMQDYEQMLQGASALFAASDLVDRQEWRIYIDALRLDETMPGVQGVGFALLIPQEQLAAHTAAVRAEGFPDYAVHPEGDRPLYSSIVYLEPFDSRNQRAFGFDMYSEPVRRAAMERARDTGKPALSRQVTLVQESDSDIQPGFLIYLPVYDSRATPQTIEERRAALLGFVYSPFRARNLLAEIATDADSRIYLELHDGEPSPQNLLFSSIPDGHAGRFELTRSISIGGNDWVLRVTGTPEFEEENASRRSLPILAGGLGLGVALFLRLLMDARHQARLRAAALELQQSRDQYLNLVENVPGTVFRSLAKLPWTFTYISGGISALSAEPVKRYLSGEVSLPASIHPDDRDRVMKVITWAVSRKVPYEIEYRIENRQSGPRWVSQRARTITDAHGNALCLEGVIIDINHRKQVEEQLRDASLHMRNLLEASLDPLLTIDADGKISDVNSACEEVTGATREHLVGSDFSDWFTEPELARAGYLKAFAEGDVRDYALDIRHLSGGVTHVLFNASVFRNEAGTVVGVFAAARDITRQKQAAEELQRHREHLEDLVTERTAELLKAKEAAEVANVAKSTFLANMSHELRTPMNAVIGLSQLLMSTELSDRQRDYLQKIQSSSLHLMNQLNDLLDFSRLEAGKLTLETREFSLEQLLERITARLGERAAAKGLTLRYSIAPWVPRTLVADQLRLNQILLNLCDNAVKYTERGEVCIEVQSQMVGAQDVLLRFSVRDTGIGLDCETQQRLFRPFEQADNSSTRKYGGSGLGLAIAQRLTDMMDGEIGVQSEPGNGSCFWFTIRAGIGRNPGATAPATARAEAPPNPQATAEDIDPRHLASVCNELSTLLAQDDMSARQCLDRYETLLRSAFGERFEPLDSALRSFDFDAAQTALANACAKLGDSDQLA